MVYYHVLFTGDKDFLFEQAGEKTVLEWMRFHAYVCDDITKDVELYDYGVGGNNHLELRVNDGIKLCQNSNFTACLNWMRSTDRIILKMAAESAIFLPCVFGCAQMIFYDLFGISVDFEGNITISPVKEGPANKMKVENARLCGKTFTVDVADDLFTVVSGENVYTAPIGEKIVI